MGSQVAVPELACYESQVGYVSAKGVDEDFPRKDGIPREFAEGHGEDAIQLLPVCNKGRWDDRQEENIVKVSQRWSRGRASKSPYILVGK